ncbi:MAG: hypothetical protein A3K19_17665 [Lentisphaerae bacterium RIFOXYB12_FULL_65_16]|nr:MAG: hypothetical protein A3K18_28820 [Lentisphaerae bacterium RIFOXYA12_64_32]OGV90112.1 MAG: hypothetical protein A3K19_17665 [Lentisphaerae bacterium RIFOXYB12_FULL_65_16]
MGTRTFITSDLHLGSPYFRRDEFLAFLRWLPEGAGLVLNGDVIDSPGAVLSVADQEVLVQLVQEAARRSVIWVWGNHDDGYRLPESGCVVYAPFHTLAGQLYVAHGYVFDGVMPRHRWFIRGFRLLHSVRLRLGARPVHVAQYAKKWLRLYRFLCRNVRQNAIESAKAHGFPAITCGHVHFAEDTVSDGVRYINTGAWTEPPAYVLDVDSDRMALRTAAELLATPDGRR